MQQRLCPSWYLFFMSPNFLSGGFTRADRGDVCVIGGQRAAKEDREHLLLHCCSRWLKCEATCEGAEALSIRLSQNEGDGFIAEAERKWEGCRFITALSIIVLPEPWWQRLSSLGTWENWRKEWELWRQRRLAYNLHKYLQNQHSLAEGWDQEPLVRGEKKLPLLPCTAKDISAGRHDFGCSSPAAEQRCPSMKHRLLVISDSKNLKP